jgi:hypothetical protein
MSKDIYAEKHDAETRGQIGNSGTPQ